MFVCNKAIVILIICFLTKEAAADASCNSYISFSYDDSVSLNNAEFKTQMNFIKNAIATLHYPNHLRVEGAFNGEFNWNSGLSITQMQNDIDSAQKTTLPYSLSKEAASLLTSIEALNNANNIQISALIFISDTSDAALKNADRWFAKLQNIEISFVLLGKNVDSLKLRKFTKNFIFWPDLSASEPDNWDLLLYKSYGCSSDSSTTLTPSVSTTVATGNISNPFLPCLSYIFFGIDDSNVLDENSYNTQLNFISSAIRSITHPERIEACSVYNESVFWYSGLKNDQIQSEVISLPQQKEPYKLRQQFVTLWTSYAFSQFLDVPISALIFISDTSDEALIFADDIFPQLSKFEITFVLLGTNVDSTKLTKFSSNFIFWPNMSNPKPDNWDASFLNAYGC